MNLARHDGILDRRGNALSSRVQWVASGLAAAAVSCTVYDPSLVASDAGESTSASSGNGGSATNGSSGDASQGGAQPGSAGGSTGGASVGGASGAGGELVATEAGPICPTAITPSGQTATQMQGGTVGGNRYTDVCPQSEMVVGFAGYVDTRTPQVIGRIHGVCGQPAIGDPEACPVTLSLGMTLPERGTIGTQPFSLMCPPNQVVVAFHGGASTLLNRVGFDCSPLLLSTSGSGYMVSTGTLTPLAEVGGLDGTSYRDGCAGGQITRGSVSVIGGGIVQAFGLICGTPIAVGP